LAQLAESHTLNRLSFLFLYVYLESLLLSAFSAPPAAWCVAQVRKTKLRDREKHYLTLASGGVDEVRAREKREENFLREALQEKLGKVRPHPPRL
jgi:hypothetical protein